MKRLVYALAVSTAALVAACSGGKEITFPTQPPSAPPPAQPAAPAYVVANGPTSQIGITGRVSWFTPEVIVRDRDYKATANVVVACTVLSGDGHVDSATVVTDRNGRANCGRWRLGENAGENKLLISVPTIEPVAFLAVAYQPSYFETFDLMKVGDKAVPAQYSWGVLLSGQYLLAPTGVFFQIQVWGEDSENIYVHSGTYTRSGNLIRFTNVFDFGFGELVGDTLTVVYADLGESATEVYRKVN